MDNMWIFLALASAFFAEITSILAKIGIKNIDSYLATALRTIVVVLFSWLCYFRALQIGDVNKVVPVDKSSTVLTMLLAMLFLGEGITWLKALCMILIGTGTYFMIERKDEAQNGKDGFQWLIYAALSAAFASLTAVLGKVGIEGVKSNLGTAIRTVVVLAMAWLIVFLQGKQRQIGQVSDGTCDYCGRDVIAVDIRIKIVS